MKKGNALLTTIVVLAAIGGVVFWISRNNAPESVMDEMEEMMEDDRFMAEMEEEMEEEMGEEMFGSVSGFTGEVIAGSNSPLLDFNQADYEKALKTNKLIVLYFYANWCPICKEEFSSALYPAFNELEGDEVLGFRVNYNDNQTDSNEKELAREFGVAYQHTKVFIKDGERILKSPESWDKKRYLEEIRKSF